MQHSPTPAPAPRRPPQSSIPIKAGCGALYLEQRKGGLAAGRIRMIQTNQHTKAAAVTEYQYSVLGQGYNVRRLARPQWFGPRTACQLGLAC